MHIITKDQVDKDLFYTGQDLSNFNGDIKADPDLGRIRFKTSIRANNITFGHKSGIHTDGDIVTPGNITLGCGLRALGEVVCKGALTVGSGILAGEGLYVGRSLTAERSIISWKYIAAGSIICGENIFAAKYLQATGDIHASRSIRAGEYISVKGNLKAHKTITAGLSISCYNLFAGLRIFAGIASFHLPSEDEKEIRCTELQHGEIAYGVLK